MKDFLRSKKGNTVLGIAFAVGCFLFLNVVFGLGGAIGGAISGLVGFGAAAVIKKKLGPTD